MFLFIGCRTILGDQQRDPNLENYLCVEMPAVMGPEEAFVGKPIFSELIQRSSTPERSGG